MLLLLLLLLATTLPVVTAANSATTAHLAVHRRRTCAFAALWDVRFADIVDIAAGDAQWTTIERESCSDVATADAARTDVEPCWRKRHVQLVNGSLVLGAPCGPSVAPAAAKVCATKHIDGNWRGVNALQVVAQFPESRDATEAVVSVHIRPLDVHMSLGVGQHWGTKTNSRTLRLTSSQNTSVLAELPCLTDMSAQVHALTFSWDAMWLRWHVDDTVVYEEPIRAAHRRKATDNEDDDNDDNASVVVEMRFAASAAAVAAAATTTTSVQSALRIESVHLKHGDADDPACAPRHDTTTNCREQTPFKPRLGVNQGYLSTDELDAFVNETVTRLPVGFARVETIGTTVQGRSIRALCVGACDANTTVPQALFTGMHHSREPISMMNLVYTIDVLVADVANGDVEALHLLFARQLWFVLVVNPDGYARNEAQRIWEHRNSAGQRKNAQPGCTTELNNGVDLNRNYDVCFVRDDVGSSPHICAEDFRGPHAFSEPETQAIRDFVERRSMNFSTALNYHSYGRYVNIPFACEASGVPPDDALAIFTDMAAEMTRYNHFKYGQPWQESNLYTVNGETSDWMWQTHGIYAMSPEVGPAFDTPDSLGFWPPIEQIPALSIELHYANLHTAAVAGAHYDLRVARVQLTASHVTIHMTLTNIGLRTSSAIELVGSMFPTGAHASDVVHVAPTEIGTVESIHVVSTLLEVPLRDGAESNDRLQLPVYVVLRDAFGCRLYRIAIDWEAAKSSGNETAFQLWRDLRLPRCGLCDTFGRSSSSTLDGRAEDAKCAGFADVTTPRGVRLKTSVAASSRTDSSTTYTVIASSVPPSTQLLNTTNSPPTAVVSDPATDKLASPRSSSEQPRITPQPTTTTDVDPNASALSANAEDSDVATLGLWDPTSFYVLLPLMALVAIALVLVVVVVRRRRRSRGSGSAGSSAAPAKRRSTHTQRYSRVVSDEVLASPRDDAANSLNDGDNGIDDDDSEEFGCRGDHDSDSDDDLALELEQGGRRSLARRPLSPRRITRSPSPKRTASPRKKQPTHEADTV